MYEMYEVFFKSACCMSTAASAEESEKEMSSPKRMRNESDDATTTISNENVSSSSDDSKCFGETEGSNEGKSSEEMNDSHEDTDPSRVLIHEAAAELRTKHNELVQSFENGGFDKFDAKKQAFSRASKRNGKCLLKSPAMDVATEKVSRAYKNNENQGCIR